jgi:succinate dehydrogenase / fumarate reductase, cytochrome b subunit
MITNVYKSTVGKKFLVALTGIVMFGFLVGHLAGNLITFAGAEKMNQYAHYLKANLPLLWGTRIVLLVSVLVHVLATISLRRLNRAARPVRYAEHEPRGSTLASRVMFWSGLFLAGYIVYHLLHFTVGYAHPHFIVTDVYANVISAFRVWYVTLIYVLAMIALGFHLYHGIWSVFQTLGLNHPQYNGLRRVFATAATLILTLGFISIPVAIFFGMVN